MSQLQTTQQTGFINPTNYQEAYQFSEMLAKSNLVPPNFKNKPEEILIAMQMGSELGLKPLQSLQSIAVIGNKPTIWGDSLVAICQGSGLLQDIIEEVTDDYATVTVIRTGQEPHSVTFSMADAEKAGLANKAGPWKQYPKRMMKNRARAFALRDKFADVLSGFGITEEEKDRVLDVTPSRSTHKASASSASINSLLETLPDVAEDPITPNYDITSLLAKIDDMQTLQDTLDVAEEINQAKNSQYTVLQPEDLKTMQIAWTAKKKQVVTATEYQNIMQQVNDCQDLEGADRLKSVIDDKASELGDAVQSLYDKLELVTEEIGAQG